MFKKKITKSNVALSPLRDPSPESNSQNFIASRKKPICKGLQYSHLMVNQAPNKSTPATSKDSPFLEKEWAKQSLNGGRNDKVLDKFMEERLKEFHAKINKIEKTEEVVEFPQPVVTTKPEEGGNEMEKLKEVRKNLKCENFIQFKHIVA